MKSRPAPAEAPTALAAVVLAAGKGTRMPGTGPKVLVECLGAPMLEHVRRAVIALAPVETVVVVGHGRELVAPWVTRHWTGARVVVQESQQGTGHAVRLAMAAMPRFVGDVLVVYGDVPQTEADDLRRLLDAHRRLRADATVLTGVASDPGRLGRIVRSPTTGRLTRIIEAREASPEVLSVREFNTGLCVFGAAAARRAVADLPRHTNGEEYLTDAIGYLAASGSRVETERAADGAALLGVNTPADLASAIAGVRRRIIGRHLAAGVLVVDPDSTVIEPDVVIEAGVRILPFTYVGHGCRIAAECVVGPFAHLRAGTVLARGVHVGNFVELKASHLGAGAKVKHLTYLGDAEVGEGANIGCGTITANFDGKTKHRTVVGAGAQIGSGTVLVAPVTVGASARTGANAVVTARRNVAPGATVVGVPARPLGQGSARSNGSTKAAPVTGAGSSRPTVAPTSAKPSGKSSAKPVAKPVSTPAPKSAPKSIQKPVPKDKASGAAAVKASGPTPPKKGRA